MSVRPNHSGNLPREFSECPQCGKRGMYRYGGHVVRGRDGGLGGHPPGKRCKYCGHRQPEKTQAEFEAAINR